MLSDAEILETLRKGRAPAIAMLGGELTAVDTSAGTVAMKFVATAQMCHSGDIVQGGFVTGWLDTSMAHCAIARSHMTMLVPTLEVKVSFFEPAHPGEHTTLARVVRWGRSTAFLEAELHDAANKLIAKASCTCRLVPRKT
jgi:acyl-CoA thioesterase